VASSFYFSTSCVGFLTLSAAAPVLLGAASAAQQAETVQVLQRVSAAENERESDVRKVTCTRQYTLRNKRWEKDGVMRVLITADARTGAKQYQILSMEAEGLQKKVFQKVLDAEIEGSRRGTSQGDNSVTPANYDFEFAGTESMNGKEYVVVHLKPKRSSKFLIAGKAWIDAKENAIVRVEGHTARSVSFWIGKPQITQSFRKVDDVWVSATNRSVSDVKLLGRTEMTVEFGDYKIVRQPNQVAHPSVRSGL
jgi:hypothetical protein